jgi:tetratricopeptide (TPR) repeat protein
MSKKWRQLIFFVAASLIGGAWFSAPHAETAPPPDREAAYRANNRGVALLEQYKYKEGAEEFRRALSFDDKLFLARVNLAIALYNAPDLDAARREAEAALKLKPDSPHARYVLGLIAKSQTRADDALREFQQVLALDPDDTGANINAGQLYAQARQYDQAAAAFRRAVANEPHNTSALYGLGQALLRANARDEGQTVMRQFQKFRQSGSGTTLSNNYLEQGRYAEAVASTGAEPDLVDKTARKVTFQEVNTRAVKRKPLAKLYPARPFISLFQTKPVSRYDILRNFAGGMALLDFDGDGDLDMVSSTISITDFRREGRHSMAKTKSALLLQRNDNGKFADITAASGDLAQGLNSIVTGLVAGDFDNDGLPDLFALGYQDLRLFRNEGKGKFKDVTTKAKLPKYEPLSLSCAFVDFDHDGDLDIFVAGFTYLDARAEVNDFIFPREFDPAPNMLLRNDGNGSFTDVSEASKVNQSKPLREATRIAGDGKSIAIVPTDFNNGRDVDLLVVNYGGPMNLFRNERDGSFKDVAAEVGLPVGLWTCVAAGDFNKDGFTDFFFGQEESVYETSGGIGVFAVSDGHGKFRVQNAPPETKNAAAAQFVDYDNDGLLDLAIAKKEGRQLIRNLGSDWQIGPAQNYFYPFNPRQMLAADFDADGDLDLFLPSSQSFPWRLKNEGGNRNNSVRVNLKGFVGNRSGVGAKVEMRAGSLGQKLEYYAASPAPAPADLVFGLGRRTAADAVRVLWPSGIVQAEFEGLDKLARKPLAMTELDLKPSSCPFLYAWNGDKFEFVTDFMGGGEMGYWLAPGVYNQPDPDEYVRIRGDQLRERDGRYELRATNELEEVLFVDHLKLIAVAHPADTEIYPDEGLGHAPYPAPLKFYKTRPQPVEAWDDAGRDVTARVAKLDNKYVDGFALHPIRGYAEEHSLTLRLPGISRQDAKAQSEKTVLLMTGWTDYAFSSDNVAAAQAGRAMQPPVIQVKDQQGVWRDTDALAGIPVGRPQTVTVDLTGKFLSASREVRIVTNMRVYYDQILVETGGGDFPVQVNELAPVVADLRWRGFSAETRGAGAAQPIGYDYDKVSPDGPWKTMPGRYTREGEVNELLAQSDDLFVISRPGDELRLSFDANGLPPLPAGWKRTFLLYADGFSKELDINSATPATLGPLPFHGMSKYPYSRPETYPLTPAREAAMERYNTRVVKAELPWLGL